MKRELNFKKYLNWFTLHSHVCALEEEFWHDDEGYDQIEAEDEDYILLMLQYRWDSIGRWCPPSMEDCSLKELLPYYFNLNAIFEEYYDPIPEYEEARSKWAQLKDQHPSAKFIGEHSPLVRSDSLTIKKEVLESYPSYITQKIIDITMKEKPNGYLV